MPKQGSQRILVAMLTAVMVLGLTFSSATFAVAQDSSSVGGIITTDTSWTKANSPYTLTGALGIAEGATLTIEAGVTVNMGQNYIQVNGTLSAKGSVDDPIRFLCTDGRNTEGVIFSPSSSDWDETTANGSIIENAIITSVDFLVEKASPKISNNTFNCRITTHAGSPLILNNSFITGDGIVLYDSNSTIAGNTFSQTSQAIYVGSSQAYSAPLIENNLIVGNGYGILMPTSVPFSPIIMNNTIANNSDGIGIYGGGTALPVIMYNNIYGNTEYNFRLTDITVKINATDNWWGTTDAEAIGQTIRDFNKDFNLGEVIYTPFLTGPYNGTPPLPPPSPNYPTPSPTPPYSGTPFPFPTPTPSPNMTLTDLSISVDAPAITVGSAVSVNGKLQDSNGTPIGNEKVILSYAIAGENTYSQLGSSTTDSEGGYGIQWLNTASGPFTLKVEWAGNSTHAGASNTTTLNFLPYENQNIFLVESNSTVTALAFNSTSQEISFAVSGTSETTGYVKATIAKSLVSNPENLKVYLDGNQLTYTLSSEAETWQLTFTYHHSTHQVTINLAANQPETEPASSAPWIWVSVACVTVAVVAAVAFVLKKKR